MRLLLDSFWRAVAYCLHPRVIVLSLLPLGLMIALATVLGYFYWAAAVAWTRAALDAWPLLEGFWGWIGSFFSGDVPAALARMVVVFARLEQKRGSSLFGSMARSVGLTVLALLALVVSTALWLIPPLVLILPPLIWGWLTYRVMSFDALAEHADAEERDTLLRTHRLQLLAIGVLCG